MKIYTLDCSYYGSVVIIEESLEKAWDKMLAFHPAAIDKSITDVVVHEISTGFIFTNYGDL